MLLELALFQNLYVQEHFSSTTLILWEKVAYWTEVVADCPILLL